MTTIYNLEHGRMPGEGFLGRSSAGTGPGELLDAAAARAILNSNYSVTFDNADLVSGVLTITHNLGVRYPTGVALYDNNDEMIGLPDKITGTSTTVLTLHMSSFGAITGTWKASITI